MRAVPGTRGQEEPSPLGLPESWSPELQRDSGEYHSLSTPGDSSGQAQPRSLPEAFWAGFCGPQGGLALQRSTNILGYVSPEPCGGGSPPTLGLALQGFAAKTSLRGTRQPTPQGGAWGRGFEGSYLSTTKQVFQCSLPR